MRAPLVSALLTLLFPLVGVAQQPRPQQKAGPAAPKQPFTLFPNVGPQQQQLFCGSQQDDDGRQRKFEARVAGAGNILEKKRIEGERPDFDLLLHAQEYGVMGNGAFRDWVGTARLLEDQGKVYLIADFPCRFTDHRSSEDTDVLSVWSEVKVGSSEAKALENLRDGDAITAAGSLRCSAAGCETTYRMGFVMAMLTEQKNPRSSMGFAGTLASVRLKNGAVVRFQDDPKPETSFEAVNALRQGTITFFRSDDLMTLRDKARAVFWQSPSAEAIKLVNFLSPEPGAYCERCSDIRKFDWISLDAAVVDSSGAARLQPTHPCERGGKQYSNCRDAIDVILIGDLPSLADVINFKESTYVPGKDEHCYYVPAKELERIRQRIQQIDDLLKPLGKQLQPQVGGSVNNACQPVIAAAKKEASTIAAARTQRDNAVNEASLSLRADEFGPRLQSAVTVRARNLGLDPSQYTTAVNTIDSVVRLCSSIPEADYTASFNEYGITGVIQGAGGKYRDCSPTSRFKSIGKTKEHLGLMVRFNLSDHWDGLQKRWYATKFEIKVFLEPTVIDVQPGMTSDLDFEAKYIAMAAEIKNPGTPAIAMFVCPGALLDASLGGSVGPKSSSEVTIPTQIIRVEPKAGSEAMIWADGPEPRRMYYTPINQLKTSCSEGSGRAFADSGSPVVQSSSSTPGAKVEVCSYSRLFSDPPANGASMGSGKFIAAVPPGSIGVLLERGPLASKVRFNPPGAVMIGWLPNSALCPGN